MRLAVLLLVVCGGGESVSPDKEPHNVHRSGGQLADVAHPQHSTNMAMDQPRTSGLRAQTSTTAAAKHKAVPSTSHGEEIADAAIGRAEHLTNTAFPRNATARGQANASEQGAASEGTTIEASNVTNAVTVSNVLHASKREDRDAILAGADKTAGVMASPPTNTTSTDSASEDVTAVKLAAEEASAANTPSPSDDAESPPNDFSAERVAERVRTKIQSENDAYQAAEKERAQQGYAARKALETTMARPTSLFVNVTIDPPALSTELTTAAPSDAQNRRGEEARTVAPAAQAAQQASEGAQLNASRAKASAELEMARSKMEEDIGKIDALKKAQVSAAHAARTAAGEEARMSASEAIANSEAATKEAEAEAAFAAKQVDEAALLVVTMRDDAETKQREAQTAGTQKTNSTQDPNVVATAAAQVTDVAEANLTRSVTTRHEKDKLLKKAQQNEAGVKRSAVAERDRAISVAESGLSHALKKAEEDATSAIADAHAEYAKAEAAIRAAEAVTSRKAATSKAVGRGDSVSDRQAAVLKAEENVLKAAREAEQVASEAGAKARAVSLALEAARSTRLAAQEAQREAEERAAALREAQLDAKASADLSKMRAELKTQWERERKQLEEDKEDAVKEATTALKLKMLRQAEAAQKAQDAAQAAEATSATRITQTEKAVQNLIKDATRRLQIKEESAAKRVAEEEKAAAEARLEVAEAEAAKERFLRANDAIAATSANQQASAAETDMMSQGSTASQREVSTLRQMVGGADAAPLAAAGQGASQARQAAEDLLAKEKASVPSGGTLGRTDHITVAPWNTYQVQSHASPGGSAAPVSSLDTQPAVYQRGEPELASNARGAGVGNDEENDERLDYPEHGMNTPVVNEQERQAAREAWQAQEAEIERHPDSIRNAVSLHSLPSGGSQEGSLIPLAATAQDNASLAVTAVTVQQQSAPGGGPRSATGDVSGDDEEGEPERESEGEGQQLWQHSDTTGGEQPVFTDSGSEHAIAPPGFTHPIRATLVQGVSLLSQATSNVTAEVAPATENAEGCDNATGASGGGASGGGNSSSGELSSGTQSSSQRAMSDAQQNQLMRAAAKATFDAYQQQQNASRYEPDGAPRQRSETMTREEAEELAKTAGAIAGARAARAVAGPAGAAAGAQAGTQAARNVTQEITDEVDPASEKFDEANGMREDARDPSSWARLADAAAASQADRDAQARQNEDHMRAAREVDPDKEPKVEIPISKDQFRLPGWDNLPQARTV